MLVIVRAVYRIPAARMLPDIGDKPLRYTMFSAHVPFVTYDDAPVAFVITQEHRSVEFRNYADGVYVAGSTYVAEDDNRAVPTLLHNEQTDHPYLEPGWDVLYEFEEDVRAARKSRSDAIAKAREWVSNVVLARTRSGELGKLTPVDDLMFLVTPPDDDRHGFSRGKRRRNKAPVIFSEPVVQETLQTPSFLDALRDDRLFRVDEFADALERARHFGPRVHRMCLNIESLARPNLIHEVSAMALRLTAREAMAVTDAPTASRLESAKEELLDVVDDPNANAAAMCPKVRSFLTAFQETIETSELARDKAVAPCLGRLKSAHDRAQQRMAANLIPAQDPRMLTEEDDIALGGLAM